MRGLYGLEKAVVVLLGVPLVLMVLGGLAYSLITGASAYESGGAVGSFVADRWIYLIGAVVLLLVLWGTLERVFRR